MRQCHLLAAITAISTIWFGQIASAADLPYKAAPAPVAAAPVFSWTGFYLGAHAGAGRATGQEFQFFDPDLVLSQRNFKGGNDHAGFVGGLHGGYNWEFAPRWVAGVEGDFDGGAFSNNSATGLLALGGVITPNTGAHVQFDTRWLASIRGRLGFTTGWWNTMFYATGGAAWAHVHFTGIEENLPPTFASNFHSEGHASNTLGGWVVGGGAEMPVSDHFIVRAEYLYYQFSGGTTTQANLLPDPGAFPRAFIYKASGENISVIRLGLTYKF